jgi:hypothetical protein
VQSILKASMKASFFRFLKSEDKWPFIKQNPFLVIAIIPLDQVISGSKNCTFNLFVQIKKRSLSIIFLLISKNSPIAPSPLSFSYF